MHLQIILFYIFFHQISKQLHLRYISVFSYSKATAKFVEFSPFQNACWTGWPAGQATQCPGKANKATLSPENVKPACMQAGGSLSGSKNSVGDTIDLTCLNFHCKHIYGFRRIHMAKWSKNTLSYWLAQLIFWVWFSSWDSTGLRRSHHWGFIGGSCGQPRWFEHRLLHGDKTAALFPAGAPEFQHTQQRYGCLSWSAQALLMFSTLPPCMVPSLCCSALTSSHPSQNPQQDRKVTLVQWGIDVAVVEARQWEELVTRKLH